MAQSIEESLLQAIKKDDVKAFNALMENARCGELRLGRFPVLSLLYLYKSRRLLAAYEQGFLKITRYEPLGEPAEISKKFSQKAGKCLRLYFDEIVSPVEMLLILDKTNKLKRIYPLTKQSSEVKKRLKSIYSIKYSLNVKFEGDGIIIDRRPLSYREKKNIATACLCTVIAVTLAVGVPVTTVALIPEPVEGEVTKLSQIDFGSKEEYTLKRDIVLPQNYSVGKVSCTIHGEGNKLVLSEGASLGELSGSISDLVIESSGQAIFTSVSEKGAIENVTVNVGADMVAGAGAALVAQTNYGTIDGVTVNVSGKLTALAESEEVSDDFVFGGIVQSNDYKYNSSTNTVYRGIVKNCTVNYSQFSLIGGSSANASFGGIAGTNNGYVQDCTVTGEITADTFDIAGICSVNNGVLSGNVNEANLSQTSSETGWNPIVCGIVLSNVYAVENCENRGSITAVSNCGSFEVGEGNEPTASAAGIAYLNRGTTSSPHIYNCINSGNVVVTAANRNVYAAGVCLSTSGTIEGCENSGGITVRADNGWDIYAGGIAAIAYGDIYKSVNEGALAAQGSGDANVGGISAHSCARFSYCYSSGDITVSAQTVCAGGILGFSEVARYGFYVYCGTVDHCISEGKISVAIAGETPAYVGGIAGTILEVGYSSGGSIVYFGGTVTDCYFTGGCESYVEYFGNIIGVCGANSYESNAYSSGYYVYPYFAGNYYIENSLGAFGAISDGEGGFALAEEDKGATSASSADIQNLEIYRAILTALGREN